MSNTYRIGYWHWELSKIDESWLPACDLVDEIWTCSNFTADALQAATRKPVKILHHIVPDWPHIEQAAARGRFPFMPKSGFVFLCIFDFSSRFARKNPLGTIEAFNRAFGLSTDGPYLIVKYHGSKGHEENAERLRAAAAENRRIILVDKVLSSTDMQMLHDASDCFVSLHRSEGFGLNIADAMICGHPAICTGYSGNLDFTNSGNALLVDYEMIDVCRGEYPSWEGQQWADPNIGQAAEFMRLICNNRECSSEVGHRARESMLSRLSALKISLEMKVLLEAIPSYSSRSGRVTSQSAGAGLPV
jgi:glycosyltransferase involved in cell wall biosynthesis